MKKFIAIFLITGLFLTGCGSNDKADENKADEDTQQESSVVSEKEIYKKLKEISNWYTSDIWNEGLCDISWYVNKGTSSTGQDLDIEMTLKRYNDAMKSLNEYNDFISTLTDPKYDDVKFAWDKLYNGIKESDKIVQENNIEAKSGLDLKTGVLSQYSDAFKDYIKKIEPEK